MVLSLNPEIALEPVDIVNRALAMIGGGAITSLDTDGDLERQAQLIYWTVVEYAIGRHEWRFATRPVKLSRLNGTPESGYRYAYGLPGGRLGYPTKYLPDLRTPRQPLRDFANLGNEVHTDAENLWAICKMAVHPTEWPGEFRMAVITLLAAELAVPVTHDLQLADAKRRQAVGTPEQGGTGGLLGAAIAKEIALSPPADGNSPDVLTEARYSGVSRSDWWR